MPEQIKSVHLFGKPTCNKYQVLQDMQSLYTEQINFFIETLLEDKKYFLSLLTNNKMHPDIRLWEKTNRSQLGSALGQNAIDHAVKECHNYLIRIKNRLYGMTMESPLNLFVSSTALFNACIQEMSVTATGLLIQSLVAEAETKKVAAGQKGSKSAKAKDKASFRKLDQTIAFYRELLDELAKPDAVLNMTAVRNLFYLEKIKYRVPTVHKAQIQLDSRLCTIQKSNNIEAPYVISVKTLDWGKRIHIPLNTSRNGLRRLEQYENCSPLLSLKNGKLRISIPFKKAVNPEPSEEYIGADVGISDLIHSSDGKPYGKYSGVIKYYDNEVKPKLDNRNKLRSLMSNYQDELHILNSLPYLSWQQVLRFQKLHQKIDALNKMLQGRKGLSRTQNRYYALQDKEINIAVQSFVKDVNQSKPTVVLEDLNIMEFDRDKKSNRRDSMWARGQLLQKLTQKLEWQGISVVTVDPAYTSQLCPVCGNLDSSSRSYKNFVCTSCGHKDDADHNASVNIRNRATDKEVSEVVEKYRYNTEKRHTALKSLYKTRHESLKTNNLTVAG